MVLDLFSRETMLKFLPDRKMERVYLPGDHEKDNFLARSSG
jgi:hypothetical protein